ncbi:MAG TPA: Dam family site-specific DNA-(adenine-N6)-methyltransferase [Tepidiformaceae bacterium]|nr:Dam family site-specific DNA-(adenine-N6)-methyltransferase [Tepidiformaceae bacterium]
MAKPFLKWAGGKARLAPRIVASAPVTFGRYHEPFAGAGAVFFALAEARPAMPAALSDANEALMECFRVVRDALPELLKRLEILEQGYHALGAEGRAALYYEVRSREPEAAAARAARLVFLNRTCYNGLYRVNSAGRFNVPHGRYARPRILDVTGLTSASRALQGVELSSDDFEVACSRAQPGDFVYLDPPYHPLSATSKFTSYTSADFGIGEQEQLAEVFEGLTRRGVAAMLSNSDHPSIRALYEGRGYEIRETAMARAINSKADGRAPIVELLVSNFVRVDARPPGDLLAGRRTD